MVLQCLATIWKSGGEINRLPDGQLELKNHMKVPATCLKVAETIFGEIDNYYKSVEGMTKGEQAVWKMMMYFIGWQVNHVAIGKFLNSDQIGLNLFLDFQTKLAQNGWKDLYTDYRQFENAESDALKRLLIRRIVEFGKGAK